jgi:lysozyme family protein/peptidoglycan hydrolase-like protein with peptidoglycan-binding domain
MSHAYQRRTPTPEPTASTGGPEWDLAYDLAGDNSLALEAITELRVTDEFEAADLLGTYAGVPDTIQDPHTATEPVLAEEPAAQQQEAPAAQQQDAPAAQPGTPTHAPSGVHGTIYRDHERRAGNTRLTLTSMQRNELELFRINWEKNQQRYVYVASQTGVPAALIAAIHYRESSMRFDTYLHQGDRLGRPAVNHPSNIPVFHVWEDAAIHALNLKKGVRTAMGMDETTTDFAAMATYAEVYNGLGYHNRGLESPYVYGGTDQYTGGRYVRDGVFDPNSFDQRMGVMALVQGLGDAAVTTGPSTNITPEAAWATVLSGGDVLRVGTSGPAVRALQERLVRNGARIAVDGEFGAGTRSAVIAFQKQGGLGADGLVGRETAARLDGVTTGPAPAPTAPTTNPEWARVLGGGMLVRRGDHGPHVTLLQELLTQAGFTTQVDGDFGRGTERQVRAFQAARRLEVDGIVGRRTATALQG